MNATNDPLKWMQPTTSLSNFTWDLSHYMRVLDLDLEKLSQSTRSSSGELSFAHIDGNNHIPRKSYIPRFSANDRDFNWVGGASALAWGKKQKKGGNPVFPTWPIVQLSNSTGPSWVILFLFLYIYGLSSASTYMHIRFIYF